MANPAALKANWANHDFHCREQSGEFADPHRQSGHQTCVPSRGTCLCACCKRRPFHGHTAAIRIPRYTSPYHLYVCTPRSDLGSPSLLYRPSNRSTGQDKAQKNSYGRGRKQQADQCYARNGGCRKDLRVRRGAMWRVRMKRSWPAAAPYRNGLPTRNSISLRRNDA